MSDGKMWEIEDGFFSGGVGTICGVDEAGRGPLAGPVYAAAVILPPHLGIPGLTDSKKLTDKKRRELFPIIQEQAIAYGIGFATEKEIDEINILQATFLAMERALGQLAVKPDLVLIDGNREKNFGIPVKTVVKGDSLSANIAAASVLAKVSRDDFMLEMAKQYPQYGFDIHAARPLRRGARGGIPAEKAVYRRGKRLPLPVRGNRPHCQKQSLFGICGGKTSEIGGFCSGDGVR